MRALVAAAAAETLMKPPDGSAGGGLKQARSESMHGTGERREEEGARYPKRLHEMLQIGLAERTRMLKKKSFHRPTLQSPSTDYRIRLSCRARRRAAPQGFSGGLQNLAVYGARDLAQGHALNETGHV